MNIQITGKNLEVTQAIRDYIDKKIGSLEKFYSNIIETRVEIEKNTHHQKGYVFVVLVNLKVPNQLIRATDTQIDLYAAIDIVKEEVERQLLAHKGKYEAKKRKEKKTRRDLKSILFFWKN